MRKALALLGAVAVLGLAGCGGGTTDYSTDSDGRSVVTTPASNAQDAVDQQNQQLQEMEQRTSQDDPTVP